MTNRIALLPLPALLLLGCAAEVPLARVPPSFAVPVPAHGSQLVLPRVEASSTACYATTLPFSGPIEVLRTEIVQDDPEAVTDIFLVRGLRLGDFAGRGAECDSIAVDHGGSFAAGREPTRDEGIADGWARREVDFAPALHGDVEDLRMIVRTQASGAPVQVVVNVHIAPPTATIDLALGVRVDFLVNDDAGHAMPQHPIHVVGDRPLELRTDRDGKSCVSGLPEGTFQMAAGDAAPYEELTFGPSHVARRNLYTGAQLVQSYGAEDVAASAARNESCLPY